MSLPLDQHLTCDLEPCKHNISRTSDLTCPGVLQKTKNVQGSGGAVLMSFGARQRIVLCQMMACDSPKNFRAKKSEFETKMICGKRLGQKVCFARSSKLIIQIHLIFLWNQIRFGILINVRKKNSNRMSKIEKQNSFIVGFVLPNRL